jgi:sulfate adenylyltransferase
MEDKVLIHPVVGTTKPGAVGHYTRVRCFQANLGHYPPQAVKLALLPLSSWRNVWWKPSVAKD